MKCLMALVLFLSGCAIPDDDDFVLGTPVDVYFGVGAVVDACSTSSYINYIQMQVEVGAVGFDGLLGSGQEVRFYTDTTSKFGQYTLANDGKNRVVTLLNMPSGLYLVLDFGAYLYSNSHDNPVVQIMGEYTDQKGSITQVVYTSSSVICIEHSIIGCSSASSVSLSSCVLYSSARYVVTFMFNPYVSLMEMPRYMLENATVTSVDGLNTIEISETQNQALYSLITPKFRSSTEVAFSIASKTYEY